MDFSSYKAMKFRSAGNVLYATMDRPATMNAVDGEMEEDLSRVFADVGADPQTRVMVLGGAGRAFSAGGDIERIQKFIDKPELFLESMGRAKALIHAIIDCPKPIIAKVQGAAIGLGATMALFCDLTIAATDAKIGDPHVKMGFVAGDGGAVIWPQLIGYARAKEYLLLGDTLTGEDAARIGLITKAVAAERLDEVVDSYAQRLATGASRAIQWTKLSVNIGLKQLATSVLDASIAYEALSNRTQDHQEAVNAFREKRTPRFTGE